MSKGSNPTLLTDNDNILNIICYLAIFAHLHHHESHLILSHFGGSSFQFHFHFYFVPTPLHHLTSTKPLEADQIANLTLMNRAHFFLSLVCPQYTFSLEKCALERSIKIKFSSSLLS